MERADRHLPRVRSPRNRDRRGHRVGAAVLRLRVWLLRWRLDRELAAAGDPREPLLRIRAIRLTRSRTRAAIASALERAIEEAERPPPWSLSPAISVERQAVRECRPLLVSLARDLREPGPVSAQGVARAQTLLTDGASSLYWSGAPNALPVELRSAIAALHLGPKLEDEGDG